MAGNTININLEVNDSGGTVNKRIRETKDLNQELSRAADLSRKAQGVGARYQAAQAGADYNRSRGAMGSTGAGARDFAKEAQGLGGLVRVYATVAANLFAVSAAFNALKEAANTSNMVRGLDQLGAASGMALGTLSKKFVEATDGAISLREAMGAVSKASAAGLSSKQILEIGDVAKKASQALGLDMTDAVSRLTRGITKLEPELLDELGIFTKIGPASEEYARSVGKSTAALTDFEKRQAFANAVLKEGRNSYKDIKLDANPYDKLESSIRNLATAGLELINKFLVPLLNVFTNNTPLLLAALTMFAGKLIGMAIPALTSWRDELVKSAQIAKAKAKEINESFANKNVESTLAKFNLPELQKNLDDAKSRYAKAVKDIGDIQKSQNIRSTKTTQAIEAGTYGNDPKDFARTQAQINDLSKKTTQEAKDYADALLRAKDAKKDILENTKKITSAENQAEDSFKRSNLEESARQRISRTAGARAEKLDILSNVSTNLQSGGWTYALYELEQGLNKSVDLKGWDKLKTRATGWAIAGAAQISLFVRSLGQLGAVLSTLGVVVAVIDTLFGKNAVQAGEFDSAVKSLSSTIETSNKVIEKYGTTITVASLSAKATNFRELGDDLDNLTIRMNRALEKQSGWDKFKDKFYSIFNLDVGTQFADKAAEGIAQQLKLIPEGPIKDELEAKLIAITGAATAREADLAKALRNKGSKEQASAVQEANKVFDKTRMGALETSDAAKQVESSLKNANTKLQQLFQSLAVTDPFALFGQSLVQLGNDLSKAAKESDSTGASIKKLLDNTENRALINPQNFASLLSLNDEFDKASDAVKKYNGELSDTQKTISGLQRSISLGGGGVEGRKVLQEQLLKEQAKESQIKLKLSVEESSIQGIQSQVNKIARETIRTGYDAIFKTASLALEKAQVQTQKAILSGTVSAGAVGANTSLSLRDIDIQQRQLQATSTLSDTMYRNNVLLERQIADKEIEKIKSTAEKEKRPLSVQELKDLQTLGIRSTQLKSLSEAKTVTKQLALDTTDPTASNLVLQQSMKQQGTAAQLEALKEQKESVRIQGIVGQKSAELQASMEVKKAEQGLIDLRIKRNDLAISGLDYLTDEEITTKNLLESQKLIAQQSIDKKAVENDIALIELKMANTTDTVTLAGLKAEKEYKEQTLQQVKDRVPVENEILSIQQRQALTANTYSRINILMQRGFEISNLQDDITKDRMQSELDLFQQKVQLLGLERDQYAQEEKSLKLRLLDKQTQSDRVKAGQEYSNKLLKIQEDEGKALDANVDADLSRYRVAEEQAGRAFDLQIERINKTNEAKKASLDLEYSMSGQIQAYDQIFRKSIDNMADALVNFVRTGKISFKSLIDDMLADLLRFELRRQMMSLYSGSGGAKSLFDFFTGGGKIADAAGGGSYKLDFSGTKLGGLPGSAKGNVFDVGLMKFAKGGTFTNSIVSSPTMFKFAQGAGLMGEAGPEAIMPLKRDSNGNLGVRSDSGSTKVDVVVNNYSSEKATTKETVDSKGNRKIEVIVGDMVADQLSRTGSSAQQALAGSYGQRPAMVRR
jgi:lambda family phage tail tape measure protein